MKSITPLMPDPLRYFAEVASAGSFHRGAGRLRVSQPSVSRALQKLERELGVELLARSRSGVRLTRGGSLLLDLYAKYQRLAQDLQKRLDSPENALSGSLRIGSYESLCQYLWPTFVRTLSKTLPHLQIQITTSESERHRERLLREQLDLVIEAEPGVEEGVHSTVIYKDRFGVYVSPSYRGPRILSGADVPFIFVSRARDRQGVDLSTHLRSIGIAHRLEFDLDSFPSVCAFGRAGLGYMVLPTRLARDELRNGAIEAVSQGGRPLVFGEHRICASQLEASRQDPRISGFLKALRRFLNE